MELNTANPYCFTYQTEELLIELLGGIRIEGLDRMRVTMKVTVVNRKHAGYLTNPELAAISPFVIKYCDWITENLLI